MSKSYQDGQAKFRPKHLVLTHLWHDNLILTAEIWGANYRKLNIFHSHFFQGCPSWIWADSLRDVDGGDPWSEVHAPQGPSRGGQHWGRPPAAKCHQGRPRCHPRVHQVEAATQTGKKPPTSQAFLASSYSTYASFLSNGNRSAFNALSDGVLCFAHCVAP